MRRIATIVLAVGALMLAMTAARATPAYAKKEKKDCTYCHVAAGQPKLNAHGVYYKQHNHSFKGYATAAAKTVGAKAKGAVKATAAKAKAKTHATRKHYRSSADQSMAPTTRRTRRPHRSPSGMGTEVRGRA